MLALIDPRVWLAFVAAIVISFVIGDWHGHSASSAKAAVVEVKRDNAVLTAKVADDKALSDNAATIEDHHMKEVQNENAQTALGVTAIRTRTIRLYVPAGACAPGPAADPAPGPDAGRAELVPEVAERIYQIGRDANQAVRDRNYCIARYNEVRDTIAKMNTAQ